MNITIENPTAEAIYEALQSVPANEIERLKTLLNALPKKPPKKSEWNDIIVSPNNLLPASSRQRKPNDFKK